MSENARPVETNEVNWKLGTRDISIMLVQPETRYARNQFQARGFRHQKSSAYLSALRAAFTKMKEERAHFLVFPEYAWPFADRVSLLEEATANLPPGGVCLAPFETLSRQEFVALLEAFPVSKDLRERELNDVAEQSRQIDSGRERINVCLAILRLKDGTLEAIPQRKTRPAALEEHGFLAATRRHVVQGEDCSFAILICFDMIALDTATAERPRDVLANARVDLVFAPECNPRPFHPAYAHAMIDLFQNAGWSKRPPTIAFASVPSGTRLPGTGSKVVKAGGFSRVVGKLGPVKNIEHPGARSSLVLSGVVAFEREPKTLAKLSRAKERLSVHDLSWIVCRPQASLLTVSVHLDGPSSDPATGRVQASAKVHRWIDGWQRIRRIEPLVEPRSQFGVPASRLVPGGLVGFESLRKAFHRELERASSPIWLIGSPGAGKTAVAASLLNHLAASGHRILWLDGETMERAPDALTESLLVRLGAVAARKQSSQDQWATIHEKLATSATVVVLDSYERWGQPLPPSFLELHRWPVRVVITSRQASSAKSVQLAIPALTPAEVKNLMWRNAVRPSNGAMIERAAKGLPLATTWLGSLGILSKAQSRSLSSVEQIFGACTQDLDEVERDILYLVCRLTAPLSTASVQAILGDFSFESPIRRLRDKQLLARPDDVEDDELHTAHPLVRQFMRATPKIARLEAALSAWADKRLGEDGRDRNWEGFPRLEADWDNLRGLVYEHLADESQRLLGLRMWRNADYFLWTTGRFRDRVGLGKTVLEVAPRTKEGSPFRLHALIDSVAETLWHLDMKANAAACERYLDEAQKLCESDDALIVERLQLGYYRARFLAKRSNVGGKVLPLLEKTKKLAVRHGETRIEAYCLNQMGSLFRTRRQFADAHRHYDQASQLLESLHDDEMLAIVRRQRGRCLLLERRYREAIDELEDSIVALEKLNLHVERAEALIHHASALAEGRDLEDSQAEFDELERYFSSVGLLSRLDEVRKARSEVHV